MRENKPRPLYQVGEKAYIKGKLHTVTDIMEIHLKKSGLTKYRYALDGSCIYEKI